MSSDALYQHGAEAFRRGNYDYAVELLVPFIKSNLNHGRAWTILIRALTQRALVRGVPLVYRARSAIRNVFR